MRFLSRVSKLGCTGILTRALAMLFALGVFATAADARGFRLGGLGLNERIEKVYDLPRIDDLKLPDGRYIDIGRIYGGSNDRKLIGYAGSSSEYLNLPSEVMAGLVKVAGFSSQGDWVKELMTSTLCSESSASSDSQ